ncbi:ABC-3 protein [Alcanivorax hongdengensis A-11-3]|uniref:ABC-3 protein n=1 Tax=Alcanivorax hongdengensis A-11-3 TaxID=1177179 RepID=L0WG96_9GAMM|nr:metal ABC transporter permease [Alcanivorax hongdengensis]EKF75868.1 ABC-3 protein [Alcanivorax hongdengensis A-11-3]
MVDILLPALIAGLLVLASHVPLGRQVLRRGIIFIDLAVAQAAATGLLAVHQWTHLENTVVLQGVAVATALLFALLLHQLEKLGNRVQEAMIGATFVVLASLAVLMLANDPHGGEHLNSSLAGQILWVTPLQLWALAGAAAVALLGMRLFHHPLLSFYGPFAVAITASVQAVGVYLVFASLIFPALASFGMNGKRGLLLALAVGAAGYLLGLGASLAWDWPSGPAVVVSLAACALFTAVGRGIAARR